MKLLIVEDDTRIAQSLQQGLKQEGYNVDLAHDGEAGFDLAYGGDYDVIVLDWMLPKMDGLELCQYLRQEGVSSRILMLTAKGETEDRVAGLKIGADDYLVKPFSFEELLARIEALMRRAKELQSEVLQLADLQLDPRKHQVTRDGKDIELSQKEFALLEYLMRNQGIVISKDQIIQRVWEFDADILPNTVEVYIGYLRNKIEKPFKNKPALIKTVRGVGYTMQPS